MDVKYEKKDANNQSKQSASSNQSVDEVEEVEVKSNSKPPEKKKALENRQKKIDNDKKLKIAAGTVKAQQERNEALKRHYDSMLFGNAPVGRDTNQATEYFNIMRTRALKSLKREETRESLKVKQKIEELQVLKTNECNDEGEEITNTEKK